MSSPALSIGKRLVELCQKGQFPTAIRELYAKNIVSIEATEMPGHPRSLTGLESVLGKTQWWIDNHTVHGCKVMGPYAHGDDRFAVFFSMDVTPKVGPMANRRFTMDEVGVYTVAGGKVVKEEFFYTMG